MRDELLSARREMEILKATRSDDDQLSTELKVERQKVSTLKAQQSQMEQHLASLRSELQRVRTANDKAVNVKSEELSTLRSEADALRMERAEIQEKLTQSSGRLEALEREVQTHKLTEERLKQELSAAQV